MTAFPRKRERSNRTLWHRGEVFFSAKSKAVHRSVASTSSKFTQQCPGHTIRMATAMLGYRLAGVLCGAAKEASMLGQSSGICLSLTAHPSESHLVPLDSSLSIRKFCFRRLP